MTTSNTSSELETSFRLPDLLDLSRPFTGATSPHYAQAAAESSAWIAQFTPSLFSGDDHTTFVLESKESELLISHAYPRAPYERFRTLCDYMNILFVLDEVCEKQDGAGARETGYRYLKSMHDADWDDGSVIARMIKQFRARLLRSCGPRSFARLLQLSTDYVAAQTREAELRETKTVLDPESFRIVRRENSAIRLCLGLIEFSLGIDLPDEVFKDEEFMTLYWAVVDMVDLANDLYSYEREQYLGVADHNNITVVMRAYGMSLQDASTYLGEQYADMMRIYMDAKDHLMARSFGNEQLDVDVARYIEGMEFWPIGNINWSLETTRYFSRPDEVKRTRLVVLRQHKVE
ncbi:terpenoid synthase [Peniophora sp. CONT]|nr:terpenoid synthase [Peniophora sp. CONT]